MPSASIVIPPPESGRPSGTASGRESGVPYRDGVLADVERVDVASSHAALGDTQTTIAPIQADLPEPAGNKRTVLYASVGVAAVVVAIAGLLMSRPHGGSAAKRTTVTAARVVTAPMKMVGSTAAGAAAAAVAIGATRGDSLRVASATPAPTAPVSKQEKRAPENAPANAPAELHLPTVKVQLRPIKIPSVVVPSISAAPSFDSIVHSATERQRVSDSDRTRAGERMSLLTSPDVEIAVSPAKIIGRVPEPAFPDALLRTGHREGLVVVRFMVDERGRVNAASMVVEQSDDELFTAAVREILPEFRFEPARTRAPESKPVSSWVSVPFRFTTKKK